MNTVFVLLLILVNAQTGELQKFEALKSYSTLQECDAARQDMGPQHVVDGLATVLVCATPSKSG